MRSDPSFDATVDLERDRQLVERCQAGDAGAFDELYRRYHRRLSAFCFRRLGDPHEAEDAAQEAFAKAWRALPLFGGRRRFYPWLTVIAANVCTDIHRRRSAYAIAGHVHELRVVVSSPGVDERLESEEEGAMAVQALNNLSERHRRVLTMREGSCWSTKSIADHEGISIPACETLLWRARQALKREYAAISVSGAVGQVTNSLGATMVGASGTAGTVTGTIEHHAFGRDSGGVETVTSSLSGNGGSETRTAGNAVGTAER